MQATPRHPRVASYICLALFLAACGGDGPTGLTGRPGVNIVAGAGVTDTIDTQLVQALVVEIRGANGTIARSGTVVRFEPQPPTDPARQYYEWAVSACPLAAADCGPFGGSFATDTTDAIGRAKVMVRLGRVSGRAVVRLVVPELGLVDSATYTVTPGAAVRVRASFADSLLIIGGTATLHGRVVDRYENTRPEMTTITAGPGTAITLDAATGTVTARDMGMLWLFTRYNSFVDSTSVRVLPFGRLVVWSSVEEVVRLVNLDGSNERTIVSGISSDLGAFPRFDPSRQHVTLHNAYQSYYGGPPNNIIVVDTTGSPRRDIDPTIGFSMVIATRPLADGTVLVVGQSSTDTSHPGYSLWRVATDNTITFLAGLPGLGSTYGGADISHSGSRVAYLATTTSATTELRVLNVSSGVTNVLEADAHTPRWSSQDDRVAYLVPASGTGGYDGVVVVSNADGTGRRGLGSVIFSPGISWSPDGTYIVGRSSAEFGMRLLRVSDGATAFLRFGDASGCCRDYWQPDWR